MYGNCVFCKRFASLNRYKICDTCVPDDELYLTAARNLLEKEGKKSILDLAEAIAVKPERIFLWIDQKRIDTKNLEYLCPKCGDDLLNGLCSCQMERFLIRTPEEPEPAPEKEPKGFHVNRRVSEKCRRYWDMKSRIRRRQKRDIWLFT